MTNLLAVVRLKVLKLWMVVLSAQLDATLAHFSIGHVVRSALQFFRYDHFGIFAVASDPGHDLEQGELGRVLNKRHQEGVLDVCL